MTQYAILIYGGRETPSPEDLAEHDRHSADLIRAGSMVAAFALTPREHIRTVRGGMVSDGPYTETREVIAGLGIIEAPDLEAALAIAKQNPATWQGGAVEVREVEGGWIRGFVDASTGEAPGVPTSTEG
ncbi:hypothetical protein GCM10025867_26450 [Frondihabitans sucicola]|uniref:YCII-related domain-containing protein n=1 Tax=Frondihabitans sucicola TaxID=1268041 RepID=A0ABM8GQ60_9MICO|nr:YciI family protein [Frondihabitans sucicola]BDZ50404.1 hypothetical protein GCM10025867_26450 [Frondihabitans sucicola]